MQNIIAIFFPKGGQKKKAVCGSGNSLTLEAIAGPRPICEPHTNGLYGTVVPPFWGAAIGIVALKTLAQKISKKRKENNF